MKKPKPCCIIIAGPNGAGKTTFARSYLLRDAGIVNFVNADLIATGLSPLAPQGGSCLLNWGGSLRPASRSRWRAR